MIADELRSDGDERYCVTSIRIERKVFGGTLADANLRSLAAVQWDVILGTLAYVEEHKVGFFLNFAVNATLEAVRIGRD